MYLLKNSENLNMYLIRIFYMVGYGSLLAPLPNTSLFDPPSEVFYGGGGSDGGGNALFFSSTAARALLCCSVH